MNIITHKPYWLPVRFLYRNPPPGHSMLVFMHFDNIILTYIMTFKTNSKYLDFNG